MTSSNTTVHTMSLLMLISSFFLASIIQHEIVAADDAAYLLEFKNRADLGNFLNNRWNNLTDVCQWQGIVDCTPDKRVTRLDLRYLNLNGSIAPGTLSKLDQLVVLNLAGNQLSGEIPADLSNLHFLQKLYLNGNQFSGSIPASIGQIPRLRVIDCSDNQLNGTIPESLLTLPNIHQLHLQNNHLTGPIPPVNHTNLVRFNVSFNQLSGPIPASMSSWSPACFMENFELCGSPLNTSCPPLIKQSHRHKDLGQKVAIGLGTVLVVALIVFLVAFHRRGKHSDKISNKENSNTEGGLVKEEMQTTKGSADSVQEVGQQPMTEVEKGYLVFFEEAQKKYELDDLLRASAEVLGRGILGTAYKAALQGGVAVVVKRLRNVNILGREEFDKQMKIVGMLKDPNILPLRAYYYTNDEKLLVYDYQNNGSLFFLLHGKQGPGWKPLDWSTRIKIARGVASGLAYLHKEFREQQDIPHGNIKSSNILIGNNMEARISDFGLAPLISNSTAESYMAGFRAPECKHSKKMTQTADIYSFGVVLLELLTGKLPFQSFAGGQGVDLPYWVNSVVREEWTTEVFDRSPALGRALEDELVVLLRVAMACVSPAPDQRPAMKQVVELIDDQIKKMDETAFYDIDIFPRRSEGRYDNAF